MRVLWVTNVPMPFAARSLGQDVPHLGGWMPSLAEQLNALNDVELHFATVYPVSKLTVFQEPETGSRHYLLPFEKRKTRYSIRLERCWQEVIVDLEPNLIHIHGSEYLHPLALMRAAPHLPTIVSIQGLISVYRRYALGGIPRLLLERHRTLREWIVGSSAIRELIGFEQRSRFELEIVRRASAILGRTRWDKAHTLAVNPNALYCHGGEILRREFYGDSWTVLDCKRHSIFLSQGASPLKGLHIVVEAAALLKRVFPELSVTVAGRHLFGVTKRGNLRPLSGYSKWIWSLIKKHDLVSVFKFVGPLSANDMSEAFRAANVFVCPSSIENSSNSIAEAQLVGVPVVASYVGGTPDLVVSEETGLLYQFGEPEMLADSVSRIFESDELALRLSQNARVVALSRHDPKVITSETRLAYIAAMQKSVGMEQSATPH